MVGLSLNHFFKDFFFWCGPFLKSLLNLLQYDFCFMFLFLRCCSDLFYVFVSWPRDVRDLSTQTRDQTHTPRSGRQSLNHGITQEVPWGSIFKPVHKHFSPSGYLRDLSPFHHAPLRNSFSKCRGTREHASWCLGVGPGASALPHLQDHGGKFIH